MDKTAEIQQKILDQGYQMFPRETVEVTDISEENLTALGLADFAGLDGWKIFKKVGRFFKKVGKKIKKVKLKSVFKVAVPLVAGFGALSLGKVAVGALAKKFGPKVAGLVKGGRVYPRQVNPALPGTSPFVGMFTQKEAGLIDGLLGGDPKKAITQAALQVLLQKAGIDPGIIPEIAAPGVKIGTAGLEIPTIPDPGAVSVSGEEIAAEKTGIFEKHKGKIFAIGAALLGIPILASVLKKN